MLNDLRNSYKKEYKYIDYEPSLFLKCHHSEERKEEQQYIKRDHMGGWNKQHTI